MWLYACKQGNLDIVTDMHIGIMPRDDEGRDQGKHLQVKEYQWLPNNMRN